MHDSFTINIVDVNAMNALLLNVGSELCLIWLNETWLNSFPPSVERRLSARERGDIPIPRVTEAAAPTPAPATSSTAAAARGPPASAAHVTAPSSPAAPASAAPATPIPEALPPVVRKVHPQRPVHHVRPGQLDRLVRRLGLRKLHVAKALEVPSLPVRGEPDRNDLPAVLEGLADRVLVNVKGEVAHKNGRAPLILDRGGTGPGFGPEGLPVLDAEPPAAEVGAILL